MTTVLKLCTADESRARLGLAFEGVTVHNVNGKGVYSKHSPHSVTVWDNTKRPNTNPGFVSQITGRVGEGKYVDPHNKGTDDERTIILTGGPTVIVDVADPNAAQYGPELRTGERVTLEFPDGTTADFIITAQRFSDPLLIAAV